MDCPQPGCHNRGILNEVAPDVWACSECLKESADGRKLSGQVEVKKIEDKVFTQAITTDRQTVIAKLKQYATDSIKRSIVQYIIDSEILLLDFDSIIENERWFSFVQLRKFLIDLEKENQNGRGTSYPTGTGSTTTFATLTGNGEGNATEPAKRRRQRKVTI